MQSYIFILDYWLEKCVAIVVFVFFGGSRAILRCLSSCSPLLERMLPQSRWGWFPKPLGMVPKAVGDGSQSRWGWFPKPLGMVPKAIGDGSQSHWGGTVSSISHHSFNVEGWPIVLSQCGGVGERVAVCKRFCPVFYVKNRTKSSCIILYSSIIWLFEMLLCFLYLLLLDRNDYRINYVAIFSF